MASVEHKPITEVWGQSPQLGPGAEPLVRGSWKHFGHWMSNAAGKFSPFPKTHLYFYSRCNGNDMGKFYVEIQGGQVTPLAPSWGRPWPLGLLTLNLKASDSVRRCGLNDTIHVQWLFLSVYSICPVGLHTSSWSSQIEWNLPMSDRENEFSVAWGLLMTSLHFAQMMLL